MRKYTVLTPENIEVEYTLADLGSRAAAAIIDMTILSLVMLVELLALALVANYAPDFFEAHRGWILGIVIITMFIFNFGYYIFTESAMNGMTYGKKFMKIRVIRLNGQPITLKHAAIRNLIKIFIDQQGIGVVMIFFTKHCRRLGDLAASTMVVSEAFASKPMSLDALTVKVDKLTYYLSQEEKEILRAWLERRGTIDEPEELRRTLVERLTQKFEDLGMLEETREIIEGL